MSHDEGTFAVSGPEVSGLMNAISQTLAVHTSEKLPVEVIVQLAAAAVTLHAVVNLGDEIRAVLIGQVLGAEVPAGADIHTIPTNTSRQ